MRNRVNFIRFSWGTKSALLANVAGSLVSVFIHEFLIRTIGYNNGI